MASGPITSWQIDGNTMETVIDFIFLGSKITADGDCSLGIKKVLAPWTLSQPWQPPICFTMLWICLFLAFPRFGVRQYLSLCAWLLSQEHEFSRLLYLVACVATSFLWMAEQDSIVWRGHALSICSSTDVPLSSFSLLAALERAARTQV